MMSLESQRRRRREPKRNPTRMRGRMIAATCLTRASSARKGVTTTARARSWMTWRTCSATSSMSCAVSSRIELAISRSGEVPNQRLC